MSKHEIPIGQVVGQVVGRTRELVGSVGESLQRTAPEAGRWLEAGLKIGVLRAGMKTTGAFVRRNPAVMVAAVAGAGLLWYAARRHARRAEAAAHREGAIEGQAKRVEARKPAARSGPSRTPRRLRTRTRRSSASPSAE